MSSELFLRPEAYTVPAGEKTADVVLKRDGSDWEEEISQNLHREHPYIQERDIEISLYRKNPEHGAGVGAIKIDNRLMVPIIVENFRMAPLDLFWYNGDLHPMTRKTLEAALQDTTLGTPVSPGQGEMTDVSTQGRVQPPFDGKYTYASLATAETVQSALEQAYASEDGIRYTLQKNAAFRDACKHLTDVYRDEKVADIRYRVVVRVRNPEEHQKIAASGVCELATYGGPISGLVADYVIGFDGRPRHGNGMFLGFDKEASYCYLKPGQHIIGRTVKLAGAEFGADMTRGQTGVFVKAGANGAVCTEPVTLDFRRDGGWSAHTAFNTPVFVAKMAGLNVPMLHGGDVTIPDDWTWHPLGSMVVPAASSKLASQGQQVTVVDSVVRLPAGFVGDDPATDLQAKLAAVYPTAEFTTEITSLPDAAPATIAPRNLFKEASYIRECPAFEFDIADDVTIKAAAVTESDSRQTVDTILGLNFVTPENVHRFLDKIPALEESRDSIARLLLASRLGLEVDSRPLRTAMFSLDSAIRDLYELRHDSEDQQ